SDIMTPLEPMLERVGVGLRFDPGPVLERPLRTRAQVKGLVPLEAESGTAHVMEALRIVRAELPRERALIGFAGAPFTLLCYLVEGAGSKDFMEARAFLAREPVAAAELLDVLGTSMARYLIAQARAGADALMLFDSWAGLLAPDDYRRVALPGLRALVRTAREAVDVPLIYFPAGGGALLEAVREIGADVVGIDWTTPLSRAARRLGSGAVVQGNLDPAALFADRARLGDAVDRVLEEGRAAAAHVFNLGHGIHHATDPDQVAFLVDRVHAAAEPGAAAERDAAAGARAEVVQ
ncbi:MAG TPA: uroporphyrinogen decarboxylase family protein, partial [Longimicrobiales bacterium]|nr:uroporphyrinogen decarboxylase family protein [Longimicrobiales bacterium]